MNRFKGLGFLSLLVWVTASFAAETHYSEGQLGEKNPGIYAGPWRPDFQYDPYYGRLSHDDDDFFQNYFNRFIWDEGPQLSEFLSGEMMGAYSCPNEVLNQHFEGLRYGHRLVTLSYLLEVLDASSADAIKLKKKDACHFDMQALLKQCKPQSADMKTFVKGLSNQKPFTEVTLDKSHNFFAYEREWLKQVGSPSSLVSSARVSAQCQIENKKCDSLSPADGEDLLKRSCELDKAFFIQICSEDDQLYGVSTSPLISRLLTSSNLMSTFNQEGYGAGCVRRFGQLMSNRERVPTFLPTVTPMVQANLKREFGDRYPHGRAYIFGALKEFHDKGLADVFEPVAEKPKAEPVVAKAEPAPVVAAKAEPVVEKPVPVVVTEVVPPPKPKKPEVELIPKSAFLQAAEVRQSQRLDQVDVDMLKFRYDYVFNMAELQLLNHTLKDYTTREALKEMQTYDKLGTHESPVPLTFLKFLIDSNNHQGLYNLMNVLGEKFWVNNDVDVKWKPVAEYIEIRNDESTGRQWQIYVINVR